MLNTLKIILIFSIFLSFALSINVLTSYSPTKLSLGKNINIKFTLSQCPSDFVSVSIDCPTDLECSRSEIKLTTTNWNIGVNVIVRAPISLASKLSNTYKIAYKVHSRRGVAGTYYYHKGTIDGSFPEFSDSSYWVKVEDIVSPSFKVHKNSDYLQNAIHMIGKQVGDNQEYRFNVSGASYLRFKVDGNILIDYNSATKSESILLNSNLHTFELDAIYPNNGKDMVLVQLPGRNDYIPVDQYLEVPSYDSTITSDINNEIQLTLVKSEIITDISPSLNQGGSSTVKLSFTEPPSYDLTFSIYCGPHCSSDINPYTITTDNYINRTIVLQYKETSDYVNKKYKLELIPVVKTKGAVFNAYRLISGNTVTMIKPDFTDTTKWAVYDTTIIDNKNINEVKLYGTTTGKTYGANIDTYFYNGRGGNYKLNYNVSDNDRFFVYIDNELLLYCYEGSTCVKEIIKHFNIGYFHLRIVCYNLTDLSFPISGKNTDDESLDLFYYTNSFRNVDSTYLNLQPNVEVTMNNVVDYNIAVTSATGFTISSSVTDTVQFQINKNIINNFDISVKCTKGLICNPDSVNIIKADGDNIPSFGYISVRKTQDINQYISPTEYIIPYITTSYTSQLTQTTFYYKNGITDYVGIPPLASTVWVQKNIKMIDRIDHIGVEYYTNKAYTMLISGMYYASCSGYYTFYLSCYKGCALFIDNEMKLNMFFGQTTDIEFSTFIYIEEGYHQINVWHNTYLTIYGVKLELESAICGIPRQVYSANINFDIKEGVLLYKPNIISENMLDVSTTKAEVNFAMLDDTINEGNSGTVKLTLTNSNQAYLNVPISLQTGPYLTCDRNELVFNKTTDNYSVVVSYPEDKIVNTLTNSFLYINVESNNKLYVEEYGTVNSAQFLFDIKPLLTESKWVKRNEYFYDSFNLNYPDSSLSEFGRLYHIITFLQITQATRLVISLKCRSNCEINVNGLISIESYSNSGMTVKTASGYLSEGYHKIDILYNYEKGTEGLLEVKYRRGTDVIFMNLLNVVSAQDPIVKYNDGVMLPLTIKDNDKIIISGLSDSDNNILDKNNNKIYSYNYNMNDVENEVEMNIDIPEVFKSSSNKIILNKNIKSQKISFELKNEDMLFLNIDNLRIIHHIPELLYGNLLLESYLIKNTPSDKFNFDSNDYYKIYKNKNSITSSGIVNNIIIDYNSNDNNKLIQNTLIKNKMGIKWSGYIYTDCGDNNNLKLISENECEISIDNQVIFTCNGYCNNEINTNMVIGIHKIEIKMIIRENNYYKIELSKRSDSCIFNGIYYENPYKDIIIEKPNDYILKVNSNISNAEYIMSDSNNFIMRYPDENTLRFTTKTPPYYGFNIKMTIPNTINVISGVGSDVLNAGSDFSSVLKVKDDRVSGIQSIILSYGNEKGVIVDYYESINEIKYSGNDDDIRFSDINKWNKRGVSKYYDSDFEISRSIVELSNYGISAYSTLKISVSGLYKFYLQCNSWCILLIDLNRVLRIYNNNNVEESIEMNLESGNHYIEVRLICLNNPYNIKVSYESISNGINKNVINKSILLPIDPIYSEISLNPIKYQTIPYITTNINSAISLNNSDEIRIDLNTNYAADPDLIIKMKCDEYMELSKNEIIYDIINYGDIQSYTVKFKYPNSILIPFKTSGIISYEISPEIYSSSILNDVNVNLIKPSYDKSGKENETLEYSFVLSEKPSKDVKIVIKCSDIERILCDSDEHIFNKDNYNNTYKINMKLINDKQVNANQIVAYNVRVEIESDDSIYNSLNIEPLHIRIEDIDKAEIKYESDCTNALIEGENCSYSFYLTSIPYSNVKIVFSGDEGVVDLPLIFSEEEISFDNDNWNIKQKVIISTNVDNRKTGDISNNIRFEIRSEDKDYKLLSIPNHTITIKDKDIPNIVMTTNCNGNIKEGEKCELNYKLTTIPSSTVEIKLSIENCQYNDVTIDESIIIVSSEWNISHKVELIVNHNYIDTINELIDIKQVVNTVDNDYKVITLNNLELTIENIDKSGIEINRKCNNEINEGEKCKILYKLKSKPTNPVNILINMINENEKVKLISSGDNINIPINGWNNEYSIDYESIHDNIQYPNSKVTISYTVESIDSNYNSLILESDVIIINNIDIASVNIKTYFPIPFYETLEGIIRISLGCKPETSYSITIQASDIQISQSQSTIIFDDSNWNETIEVKIIPSVSLLDDGKSDIYYISYQPSGDSIFKSIVLYPNEMKIYDLISTLIVENTIFDYIKEGEKGILYYYLSERPTSSVDVYIKCPSTMDCKIENNNNNNNNMNENELKIRFNPIDYNNKIRMTISIYEDVIARGNYSEEIKYELKSDDEIYNNQEIIPTIISIYDPTIPSLNIISNLPNPFYENNNGNINMILNSKPNDIIRLYYMCSSNIKCSTSNENENENEDGLIIIKPNEWFIPKVLNIKSESNNEVENENMNGSIRFISQSNDILYNNMKINEFVFEIIENDKAELILSKNLLQLYTNTNTNNNNINYKVKFSLRLSTKPSESVEIQFNYDETLMSLNESSIIFNRDNYNIEKEIEIKYISTSFHVYPLDSTIGFSLNTNDIHYKSISVPTLKLIIKDEIINDITEPPKMILAKLEESDDIIKLIFDNDCYVNDMGKYRKYDCNGLFSNKTMLLLGSNSSCEWISNNEMNIYIGNNNYNSEINENSVIELNEDGNRGIKGSENSILYSTGKIKINLRESVPKMLSSQFSSSGVSIQVYFDRDIYSNILNNNINGSVDCSMLFKNENLGYGSYCQLSSKNSIRITLGISATILPVDISPNNNNNNNNCNENRSLYLVDNMIKSTLSSKYGSSGCINVLLPNELPIPYPVISGFTSISYCSEITFDGTLTTQTAGRDGVMSWYLENITNIMDNRIMDERINKIIDDCNAINCKIINIPSYTLSPGYYKLSLKVKNYLNPISNITSHYFHIKAIGIPEISIEGSLIKEMPNNEDIYLTVRGYWPDCYETDKNDFRFIWDIYNVNDNTINIKDFLTNDNKTLYIKSFSLPIDIYYITATTYIEGNPSIKSNITIELNIIAKKLSCIIKDGNREVGSDNKLILNGSLSIDPSDPSNNHGELNYKWKCSNYKTGKNCPSSIISPQSSIWYIPSGILTIGEIYLFELTINKEAFGMNRISKDSVLITIIEGQPPDIHLTTSKEYILPTEIYEITAVIEPSRIGDKLYWSLIESDKSFDDIFILPSDNNNNIIMIKPNSLTRGYKYELKCTVVSKYGNSSNIIELLVHNGPSSGYIIAENRNGTELKTLFKISSDGWNSDLPSNSYSYKFAYIYKNEEISLQSDYSSSNTMSVYLPRGDNEIIVYVKDVHGYISKGMLDINGEKVIIHVNKDENLTKEKIYEFIDKTLNDEKYRSNFDHIISEVITISQSNIGECDRIKCVNGECVNGKCICKDNYKGELCDIPESINGGWSEWSEWSKCSSSCGGGISYKYRKCDNPKPLYGGLDCIGNDYESIICNDIPCGDKKINGGWSEWSEWSLCNYDCKCDDYGYHEGYEERRRSCTNPSPSINGDMCIGDEIEKRNCSVICDNKIKLCPNEYRDKSGKIYGKACSGHGKCYYSISSKDNNENYKCNEGEKGCFTYCKCDDNYDGEKCNLLKDELKERRDLNHKLLEYIEQGISNIILKNELYYQLISSFKIFVEEASEIDNEDLKVILGILSDNMRLLSKSNNTIEKNNIKSLFDVENQIYMEFYRSDIENIPNEIEYLNEMFKDIEKHLYIQYYPSESALEYENELFSYYFYKEKSSPYENHQINSLSVSLPKSYSYNNNYRSVQLIDWILNPFVSNEQLNSSIVSISLLSNDNENKNSLSSIKTSKNDDENNDNNNNNENNRNNAITFTIKIPSKSDSRNYECVYFDPISKEYRSKGVILMGIYKDKANDTYIICMSLHLTEFGSRQTKYVPSINLVNPIKDANLLGNYDVNSMFVPIILGILLLFFIFMWFYLHNKDCEAQEIFADKQYEMFAKSGKIDDLPPEKSKIDESNISVFFSQIKSEHTWIGPIIAPNENIILLSRAERCVCIFAILLTDIAVLAMFHGTRTESVTLIFTTGIISALISLPASVLIPHCFMFANKFSSATIKDFNIFKRFTKVKKAIDNSLLFKHENDDANESKKLRIRFHIMISTFILSFIYIVSVIVGFFTFGIDGLGFMLFIINIIYTIHSICGVKLGSSDFLRSFKIFLFCTVLLLLVEICFIGILFSFTTESSGENMWRIGYKLIKPVIKDIESYGECCGYLSIDKYAVHDCMNPNLLATGYNPINCMNTVSKLLKEYSPLLCIWFISSIIINIYLIILCIKFLRLPVYVVKEDKLTVKKISEEQRHAAHKIQGCLLKVVAKKNAIRREEYKKWYRQRKDRKALTILVYTFSIVYCIFMMYLNLLYGIKFGKSQSVGWIIACVVTILIDVFIQQPIFILCKSVAGTTIIRIISMATHI